MIRNGLKISHSRAEAESEADVKPVIYEDGITYSYVQYNNVYLLAISRTNVNCMSTLYFLHRLVDVFKFYFQACLILFIFRELSPVQSPPPENKVSGARQFGAALIKHEVFSVLPSSS